MAKRTSSPSLSAERRAQAADPTTRPAQLESLAREYPDEVARNPNCPTALWLALAEAHTDAFFDNPAFSLWELGGCEGLAAAPYSTALSLVKHPRASPLMLDILAERGEEGFWRLWVKHPALSTLTLSRMASRVDSMVQAAVARHPQCPEEILRTFLWDRVSHVRGAASRHPRAPRDVLEELYALGADARLQNVSPTGRAFSEEELRALAARGDFGRQIAAHYPNAPRDILDLAAQHHEWSILLANPNTPPDLLARLSLRVSGTRMCERAVRHPKAPPELLTQLMLCEEAPLRALAVKHPNAPRALHQLLMRAGATPALAPTAPPDPYLSAAALAKLAGLGLFGKQLAARHPKSQPSLLNKLATERRIAIDMALLENPSTPAQARAEVWSRRQGQVARVAPRSWLDALATIEKCTHLQLAGLLGNPHTTRQERARILWPLRTSSPLTGLATNTSISEDEANTIARHPAWTVRAAIAAHPKLPRETRRAALYHAEPGVRAAASSAAPREDLWPLWRAGASADLRSLAMRPASVLKTEERAALCAGGHWGEVLSRLQPERKPLPWKPGLLHSARAIEDVWCALFRSEHLPRVHNIYELVGGVWSQSICGLKLPQPVAPRLVRRLAEQLRDNPAAQPAAIEWLQRCANRRAKKLPYGEIMADPRIDWERHTDPLLLRSYRWSFAHNPALSPERIAALLASERPVHEPGRGPLSLRRALALNPATPEELWKRLLTAARDKQRRPKQLITRRLLWERTETPPLSPWLGQAFPQAPTEVDSWSLLARSTREVVGLAWVSRGEEPRAVSLFVGHAYQPLSLAQELQTTLLRLSWWLGARNPSAPPIQWIDDEPAPTPHQTARPGRARRGSGD